VSSSQRPSSAILACGSTQSCPCVNMSRVLLRHVFPPAPSTLCSSTTRPRRVCATGLGPCAVAPRLLQRRPRRPAGGDTGTTAESPARGGETRARPETTRPCNSRLSRVTLASVVQRIEYKLCLLVHKALIGQAPDYITNLLMPVTTLFTARFQQRRPLPAKNRAANELLTVHSLSPHLVHGIAYRQN